MLAKNDDRVFLINRVARFASKSNRRSHIGLMCS